MNDFIKKIPKDKAYYITGLSDGEGSFNTSFRLREDFLLGWKYTPVFNISQKQRDIFGNPPAITDGMSLGISSYF